MVPCLQSRLSMRWPAMWSVWSVVCLGGVTAIAACSDGPGEIPGEKPDGPPAFTGLTLDFIADAQLPVQVSADVRVDDVYMNGSIIRAVGDASTEEDQSTTRHDHELFWDRDSAPGDVAFTSAPVGEYSYVELRIASRPEAYRTEAFEVHGAVRKAGDD